MSQVRRLIDPRITLLFVVRHGDSDAFRWLRATFAGQPVWIAWDRRVRERRSRRRRISADRRQRDRRGNARPLSLRCLRFIAVDVAHYDASHAS
jgi:hypothetical protein